MAEIPSHARAVIIGGGVSGCSVAYHLAKLGWTDVVLLERKQLTCGTTWHAAGLIGQLRHNQNMTRLAKYSADLYLRLEEETGVATGMRRNGSITVALTAGAARGDPAQCLAGAGLRRRGAPDRAERGQEPLPPPERLRRGRGRASAGRRPVRPGEHRAGAGQGRAQPRRADRRGGAGHRHHPAGRARHRRGMDERRGAGHHRDGHRRELRRHVGARGRRPGGRRRAAARLRALLHRDRADRGAQPAAGAARARRVRLLQGGRRQDDARRLRAQGQALAGAGRAHPRRVLLRPAARGHRALRADPRDGRATACRCWARPASTPSSTVPRASRRTTATISARRRSAAASGWPAATTRSASSRRAARGMRWRNGWRTGTRPSTSGTSTSAACSPSSATAATCASGSARRWGCSMPTTSPTASR